MTAGIGNRFPDPNAQVTFADENDDSSVLWSTIWNTYSKDDKLRESFQFGDYPWAFGSGKRLPMPAVIVCEYPIRCLSLSA